VDSGNPSGGCERRASKHPGVGFVSACKAGPPGPVRRGKTLSWKWQLQTARQRWSVRQWLSPSPNGCSVSAAGWPGASDCLSMTAGKLSARENGSLPRGANLPVMRSSSAASLTPKLARMAPARFSLDPAVGRARAGRHRPRWQGANRSHGRCHGEDLQRRQRGRGRLDRVRSGLTSKVNPSVAAFVCGIKALGAEASGQLPDLGSARRPRSSRPECVPGSG
jgi:hypothetical protein